MPSKKKLYENSRLCKNFSNEDLISSAIMERYISDSKMLWLLDAIVPFPFGDINLNFLVSHHQTGLSVADW